MAEERIRVVIEDAELQDLVAKMDEALAKKRELITDVDPERIVELIKEGGPTLEELLTKAHEADELVEEVKEKLETAFVDAGVEPTKIPYLFYTVRRLTARIPILREAVYLLGQYRLLTRPGMILPIAVILAGYTLLVRLLALQERMKREEKEYRRMIMEARGFKFVEEYEEYKREDRRLTEASYRGGSPG